MRSSRVMVSALVWCFAMVAAGVTTAAVSAPGWADTVTDVSVVGTSAAAPRIAADLLGDVVVVFSSHDDSGNHVQAAYRPAGGPWGSPVTLSVAGQDASEPRVAVDGKGRAVAVWTAVVDGASRLQSADRRTDGSWSAPTTVSDADSHAGTPEVAVGPGGGAVVVWRGSARSGDAPDDVRAAYRPAGGSWGSPLILASNALSPHVAVDGQGRATAVWTNFDGTSTVQSAELPAGGAWTSPVTLSDPARAAYLPSVAVNASGAAVAVWCWDDGSNWRTQAASRPSGGTWGQPVNVSDPGRSVERPEAAVDGQGSAVAVWRRTGVVNGDSDAVQVADLPVGGSWSAPVIVSGNTAALDPHISVDVAGNVVATWQQSDGSNWRTEVVRRPVGKPWNDRQFLSDGGQDALWQQVAVDGQGNAVAAWSRSDGAEDVVQALGFDYAGPVSTMTRPVVRRQTTTAFNASWSAVDAWGQVASHDVRYRAAGYDGSLLPWVTWLTETTSDGARFTAAPGHTVCFSVRSRDDWGRLGTWSAQKCTATPVDDRTLMERGEWTRTTGSGLYRGTQTVSRRHGDVLVLRSVRAKQLSLLVTRAPGAGRVSVNLAGETLGSYSLASSAVTKKSLIRVATFPMVRTGTLRIRVVSPTGKRVRIDGVVALRD